MWIFIINSPPASLCWQKHCIWIALAGRLSRPSLDDFSRSQTNANLPAALTPQQLGRGLMSLPASQNHKWTQLLQRGTGSRKGLDSCSPLPESKGRTEWQLRQSFSSCTPWGEQGRDRPQPCIFLHALLGKSQAWSKTRALIHVSHHGLSVHASVPTVLGNDKAKRKIERVGKNQPARRCTASIASTHWGKGWRCTWQLWWRMIHFTGIFPWVRMC